MDLAQILDLIRQNGSMAYGLIFGYAMSNSLLFVVFAGYAAYHGALDWGSLVLLCWAGSFAGDVIRFWIGQRFGIEWLARFPWLYRGVTKTARLVDLHYRWLPFVHRFPNGVRNFAGIAYGISSVPPSTFHAINFIAAGIWALAVVSAGYGFGKFSEKTLNDTASGVSLAALIAFMALFWLLGKRLERTVEAAAQAKGKAS